MIRLNIWCEIRELENGMFKWVSTGEQAGRVKIDKIQYSTTDEAIKAATIYYSELGEVDPSNMRIVNYLPKAKLENNAIKTRVIRKGEFPGYYYGYGR